MAALVDEEEAMITSHRRQQRQLPRPLLARGPAVFPLRSFLKERLECSVGATEIDAVLFFESKLTCFVSGMLIFLFTKCNRSKLGQRDPCGIFFLFM